MIEVYDLLSGKVIYKITPPSGQNLGRMSEILSIELLLGLLMAMKLFQNSSNEIILSGNFENGEVLMWNCSSNSCIARQKVHSQPGRKLKK